MALDLPHVSIVLQDKEGNDTQSELTLLSLGYGLHQAWIYAAMFGTTAIFPSPALQSEDGLSLSLVFLISIVAFAVALLFAGITDQRFLRFYTSKSALAASAATAAAGTAAILGSSLPGAAGTIAVIFAGIATGLGSAMLLLFWGIAFAREDASTIVLNAAVGIAVALVTYTLLIYTVPQPLAASIVICLPLIELPLLWRLTPVSYAVRREVPIFSPLPVSKGAFSARFAVPVLLFGLALGMLRSLSTQVILPSPDLSAHLFAVTLACLASVVLLVALFYIGRASRWESPFRLMVPIILAALFFVPLLFIEGSAVSSTVLLASFMCFEALMWIFFSQLCQEFRFSPVYVFGIGRGCLALGSLGGALMLANHSILGSLSPLGETGAVLVAMLALVVAYALLPRVRDIRRATRPHFDSPEYDRLNIMVARAAQAADSVASAAEVEPVADATAAIPAADETDEADAPSAAKEPAEGADPGQEATSSHGAPAEDNAEASLGEPSASAEPAKRRGRPPKAATDEKDAEAHRKSGRFRTKCEMIANKYLLSRRETEVLFLLARGHNAAYIQKKLYITQSTAKTHIYHIYQKLGIHTQQELLAMVSEKDEN